ncbi:LCM-domain-containing protein [Echria macrotheca]|uniref:tRNA wybutosine-synthesizing protein 4 n=1 Tax=Echria macrotheca TaxID=438768 RepID=A0AAJ0FFE4_9PEZI|nr:LCM-domain-containing protein [Echria macrotheca]
MRDRTTTVVVPADDDDTTSTLGPASTASSASIRSLSPIPSPRSHRLQKLRRRQRLVSFASAVLSSLCAGSVTVFSLYGHIFQERLHYSQFQVNGLASAASIAMYIPVPVLGYMCDRVGPAPLSLLSGIFFGAGYGLAAGMYQRAVADEAAGAGRDGGATAFVAIGVGTCSMYMSAVATCAKNFGKGKHRGLALAVPIAAFGLSGMWQSQVGSRIFYERLADGTRGDVDVFRFFVFLAVLLFVVGLIGTVGLKIVDEQDLIDEAVEELERSGLLDGSALFTPGRTERGYGAIERSDPFDDDDDAGILDPSKDPEEEEARLRKKWVLNAETRRFLTDPTMWCFALGFFFMIGPGEAFINNMGTIIKTLYPPTLHYAGAPTSAATHVSIVGITSTVVRLLTGSLTDWLAPSPQTQHVQITGSGFLQRSRFSVSRVAFLLFYAGILSLGMVLLASGLIQNHGERFWIVSGLVGAGYGAVFSLTPIIITVIWGVENFATNWGIVAMFPALGATIWGLVYSAVYQAGTKAADPGVGNGEEDLFCYGVECYARAFWAMAISVWIAAGLVLWAWKGRNGTQKTNAAPPQGKSARAKKAQDDQVMGTNNSSIVSKRSVEVLYYPSEPHFFRFFVSKYQQRSPLINRGYHLRMHVVDVLVGEFLRSCRTGKKRKVVVNLGCGSDVLPWQCLTRYGADCSAGRVKFVDVDFEELILRKRGVVEATAELHGMLSGIRRREEIEGPVVFDSEEYAQVGCDLRRLDVLRKGLGLVLGGDEEVGRCEFLFVAEVSITYMDTEGADGVIQWASGMGAESQFVLLEQILPGGEDHPFAETMLGHFRKLNTELKSVTKYSTLGRQVERFASRGWGTVKAWTLWQAWGDEFFFGEEERRRLDEVEMFDEWEEFALFGGHYCLIYATTTAGSGGDGSGVVEAYEASSGNSRGTEFSLSGQRRFGAAMLLSEKDTTEKEELVVVNTLGLGTRSRLQSCDVFHEEDNHAGRELNFGDGGPTSRMCHSLTDLGDHGILLTGGRTTPAAPLGDCWLFNKTTKAWTKTHELPVPLFRHSVAGLGSGKVLLAGGRTAGEKLFGDFLVFHPKQGWITCEVADGCTPAAVYGAALAVEKADASGSNKLRGVYIGGLRDGVIVDQILRWEVDISDVQKPVIRFTEPTPPVGEGSRQYRHLLTRFGATCFYQENNLIVMGGVARDHLLHERDEILVCSSEDLTPRRFSSPSSSSSRSCPRPLLVGHSAVSLPDGRIVTVGGGATCFSMGTFWNKGVFTFRVGDRLDSCKSWVHEKSIDIIPGERVIPIRKNPDARAEVKPIPRVRIEKGDEFTKVLGKRQPVVIEGMDLGACLQSWTLDYLTEKIGSGRKVVIHDSATQAMNFATKNFRYVTTTFGEFAERVKNGDSIYLRALSEDKPSEKPALLAEDFPFLAADFVLPPQLSQVTENLFSSVLRMSGPVNMWLHYDVMANIYCQIGGTKRMVLFPPSDVDQLSFAPGASSSSIDVFASLDSPDLTQTHLQECILTPGDVLFLPPLWLHTATPISDASVAVNVFFKDLDASSYAAGRDVYGNRDLAAYEKGRLDVARVANSFKKLPADAREFYILRLADELRRMARG